VSSALDSLRLSAARPPAPPPPRCSCSTPALPPSRATAAAIAELKALAVLLDDNDDARIGGAPISARVSRPLTLRLSALDTASRELR